ncbi:hypothetical protein WA1_18400 [Scytonema hofmannii PCC 7110]|uniref:Glycosyltransferase family 2 protein n=2 Tax=Scytonema hofmannii TaxID=34078 RepID=A0A139XD03_9CYAN|nr:hypothetical protein WA1_18400 [Scytonema hofmannii PCC 7110]
MTYPSCALSIMVARTDIPFMMHTIPHLVRTCNFPFNERVLAVDTAPLSGDKVGRPGIGTMEQLRNACEQLLSLNVVDKIVDFDYTKKHQQQIYKKHFGSAIKPTHNYKGYPILGTIFKIENCKSDYFLHFDSDMLLHQKQNYNWIEHGIQLMQENPEVIAVRPLTGPPTKDGNLYQRFQYEYDTAGFYRFKFFSSRAYLINRKRFESFLPIPVIWRPFRREFLNALPLQIQTILCNLTGAGALDSWEVMVSKKMEQTSYVRATIASDKAWTLHPVNRSQDFIQALPKIIEKIEAGWYPPEQAGHYDLKWDIWQEILV